MLEQVLEPTSCGLRKGQVLVWVISTERETTTSGREVFVFRPREYPIKGLIFPNDETIYIGTQYNVVVNGIIPKSRGALVMSEVYHEPDVKDVLQIKISGISPTGDGMFKINGYLGFVQKGEEEIKVGDEMSVEVRRILPSKHKGIQILNTVPY